MATHITTLHSDVVVQNDTKLSSFSYLVSSDHTYMSIVYFFNLQHDTDRYFSISKKHMLYIKMGSKCYPMIALSIGNFSFFLTQKYLINFDQV